MEKRPVALLLKFPGTNCEHETAKALELVGFEARVEVIAKVTDSSLDGVDLVVFSGGFSYGDYVMSGRFAKLELERKCGGALEKFVEEGGYALGICNGFQILTQLGLLPKGSLIDNASGRFICRWAGLRQSAQVDGEMKSEIEGGHPYLSQLPQEFELPIAHAEGRFVALDKEDVARYAQEGQVALNYTKDVNGSTAQVAALQSANGRVFGLMPHPERFIYPRHHYDQNWSQDHEQEWGWGYYFFKSIHDHVVNSK